VSSLDFANAVVIDGFRVPALSTRRTETEVELRDGQTFAIAGLLNNTLTNTMSKIPGIGDIPILGNLFRSKAHQKNQTELVVMITPVIIKRGQMGVSEGLPALIAPYLEAPNKTYQNPDPYVGSPRFPPNQPKGSVTNLPSSAVPEPKATAKSAPVQAQKPATEKPVTEKPVTRPIQSSGALPLAAAPAVADTRPAQAAAPAPAPAHAHQAPVVKPPAPPAGPTKAELKALEQQRAKEKVQQKKAADEAARQKAADDKRKGEQQKAAQQKAEEDRRAAEKLAKERGAREAEVARKSAEASRRQAEEDQRRDKVLADAAARLHEAQAAYQAEVDKAKGATSESAVQKSAASSAPRQ
jgi:hypothetical protein